MVAMSMHVAPSLLMVRGCYNEWQQARDVDSQVCGPLLCRTQLAVLNDFVVLRYVVQVVDMVDVVPKNIIKHHDVCQEDHRGARPAEEETHRYGAHRCQNNGIV